MFMAEMTSYYYVMSFELKNVGATYQHLMYKILQPMLGRNMEAYVDDMMLTSTSTINHKDDLEELFATIA